MGSAVGCCEPEPQDYSKPINVDDKGIKRDSIETVSDEGSLSDPESNEEAEEPYSIFEIAEKDNIPDSKEVEPATEKMNDIDNLDAVFATISSEIEQEPSLTKEQKFELFAFRAYSMMDIKDRKYHMKTYKSCFEGHQLVDWTVKNEVAMTRNGGIKFGETLVEMGIIRSSDGKDYAFEDSSFFYYFVTPLKRFKDFTTKDTKWMQHKDPSHEFGGRSEHCLICNRFYAIQNLDKFRQKCESGFERDKLIKDRKYHMKKYPHCFVAEEAVTWMIKHKIAESRNEAVEFGQRLVDNKYWRHVATDHPFRDEKKFYEFV